MKVKLENKDVLELSKAIKGGWLDMDKVAVFKPLLRGYNPNKVIRNTELNYYLDCLREGWGFVPSTREQVQEISQNDLPDELKAEWIDQINDGSIYSQLIKDAFLGLCAMKALGGMFTDTDGDFSFMGKEPNF